MLHAIKTAKAWDSYRESLEKTLNNFDIHTVLEYGPGESTKIFQSQHQIIFIYSIEHNEAWGAKVKEFATPGKVHLVIEPDEEKYPYARDHYTKFDLIFIDGIARAGCLRLAPFRLKSEGMVFLHDAERPEYKSAINSFEYKFPIDEGHTMIMTNNADTATKLSEILW